MGMKCHGPVTLFKDLSIGERFEFNHTVNQVTGDSCLGLVHGPWVKTSARCYRRADQESKIEIGSINAKTVKQ